MYNALSLQYKCTLPRDRGARPIATPRPGSHARLERAAQVRQPVQLLSLPQLREHAERREAKQQNCQEKNGL